MASAVLIVVGVLLIIGGLASVFLSIIPSITNAGEAVSDVANDPTQDNAIKAGFAVGWAVFVWWISFAITVLAFIGGAVLIIVGFS